MYSKRIYITKTQFIERPFPIGRTQVPYLASLPIDPFGADDPYHWDIIYDDTGDLDGIHPGTNDRCLVAVFCEETEHEILESDPDIIRIDDL